MLNSGSISGGNNKPPINNIKIPESKVRLKRPRIERQADVDPFISRVLCTMNTRHLGNAGDPHNPLNATLRACALHFVEAYGILDTICVYVIFRFSLGLLYF